MGCGNGALSIPLAKQGHPIVAADFSRKMLDILDEKQAQEGLDCVTTKLMSWEDDWEEHGLTDASVDLALASRSIATSDLKRALLLLDRVAARRVCITLATGSSPRFDEHALRAIGLGELSGHDNLYAFNILVSVGIKPQLSYIETLRKDSFDSLEDAFEKYSLMVEETAPNVSGAEREAALARLHSWLGLHLRENPDAGQADAQAADGAPQKRLCLDRPRTISWAFIAWDK